MKLNQPVVGMASTPSGNGYWLVADGGVFSLGMRHSTAGPVGMKLNRPVVGMASTPSGNGYWLVAADGGIFSFGDTTYQGSVPGAGIHISNIVGLALTP